MQDLTTSIPSSQGKSHLQDALLEHLATVVFVAIGAMVFVAFGVHTSFFSRCDRNLTIWVNALAHRSWLLDRVIVSLSENLLVKGLPALAVFFYAWFQSENSADGTRISEKRQILLYSLLICAPAVLLARVLAWSMPYRGRPITNGDLHLRLAYTFEPGVLLHWSSFPSDHAVLFFALATGVSLACWRAGALLYLHALIVIAMPRLYLGVHYASDLAFGAFIGCVVGYLASWPALRSFVARPGMRLQQYSPGIFYAALFYLAVETAELYDHVRLAAVGLSEVVRVIAHHLIHHG